MLLLVSTAFAPTVVQVPPSVAVGMQVSIVVLSLEIAIVSVPSVHVSPSLACFNVKALAAAAALTLARLESIGMVAAKIIVIINKTIIISANENAFGAEKLKG